MAVDGSVNYEITGSAEKLNSALGSAMNSVAGLAAKLTALSALAAAGAGAGIGLATKIAADREQVRVAMEGIIGDVGKAQNVMKELQAFAASTPFEFPELADAARKLLSGGVATEDLITELTALGNVAAAVGTDVGGLASIYTQIADKGKVYAEELMQFGERGAGAIKTALAESLGVSKAALIDMVSEGKVSFDQFRAALQGLAGETGKWGGMMSKQSQTTLGLFSTLKDTVNEVMLALGEPINDAIKPILSDAIGMAEELKPMMGEIGQAIANMATAARDFIAEASSIGGVMTGAGLALADAIASAMDTVWQYLEGFGAVFAGVAMAFGKALITAVDPVVTAMKHGLASAALHAASVLMQSLQSLPGIGARMQVQGMAAGAMSQYEADQGKAALDPGRLLATIQTAMEGFGQDFAKAMLDARDILRGGEAGDDRQMGTIATQPDMTPRQLLPNITAPISPEKQNEEPASQSTSTVDGITTVRPQQMPMVDWSQQMTNASTMGAMTWAGDGEPDALQPRRRISGANQGKRSNWRQREWQRMGQGARDYFSASIYGSTATPGGAEARMMDTMGRGPGSRGGRPQSNTRDAATSRSNNDSNTLKAILRELQKLTSQMASIQST